MLAWLRYQRLAFDNLLLEDQILISQGIINVNTDDPFISNENVSFDTSAGLFLMKYLVLEEHSNI